VQATWLFLWRSLGDRGPNGSLEHARRRPTSVGPGVERACEAAGHAPLAVDERRSYAAGLSGTLVLRGERGVGNTSLLLSVQTAPKLDRQIAHLEGVDSEVELGFAALHQLIRPSLGDVDMLRDCHL
jgi:hypothetical protein